MSVAFQGMGSMVVTFQADLATTGNFAALVSNNTVKNANGGVAPVGLILNKRNDHAAVQTQGYIQANYSGDTAPSLGLQKLVADGTGGLRLEGTGETGRTCLVVNLDADNKTMGLFL